MLKKIKIISLISLIITYHLNIQTAQSIMRLTINNPKNNSHSRYDSQPATAITDRPAQTSTPKETSPSLVLSTVSDSKSVIPESQLHEYDVLDTESLQEKLPPQISTRYPIFDGLNPLKSTKDRILELINFGAYNLAYAQEQTISAHNSIALKDLTHDLETLFARETEHTALKEKQRQEIIDAADKVLLLLAAINAHYHPKKIDPNSLKSSFEQIQKIRIENKQRLKKMMTEEHAIDNALKAAQKSLHQAHPNGATSLALTPRKDSLNNFVIDCLKE